MIGLNAAKVLDNSVIAESLFLKESTSFITTAAMAAIAATIGLARSLSNCAPKLLTANAPFLNAVERDIVPLERDLNRSISLPPGSPSSAFW